MKLTFYIDYRTNWGESVYLIDCNSADKDGSHAIKMDFDGMSTWFYTLTLPRFGKRVHLLLCCEIGYWTAAMPT